VRCFYHPGYTYPLPEEHPFPMDKFWRAEEMIRAECPQVRIVFVEPASAVQLMRVHTAGYLTTIRTGTLSREEVVRLGLPPCEDLLTRSRRETAGTVAATWAALEDGLACNLAGGTHENDRFGQMKLSDVDMAARDRAVLDLVTKLSVSAVVLYGGGYNRDRVHTARLHANTVKLAEGFWFGDRRGAGSTIRLERQL